MENLLPIPKEGKDLINVEVNFEEYPFFRLSKKNSKTFKTIKYERWSKDSAGNPVHQKWMVSTSDEYGLPGPFDMDVKRALDKVATDIGLDIVIEKGMIPFSLYKIIDILNLNHSGVWYAKVKDALKRMAAATIESKSAFYRKGAKDYLNRVFHYIDDVVIYDREEAKKKKHQPPLSLSVVYPSEWYLESLKAYYIKNLDLNFYLSLASFVAKRLYSLLDKRGHQREIIRQDLFDLAKALPLDQKYLSDIKRSLTPACDELVKKGFLEHYSIKGKEITFHLNQKGESTEESKSSILVEDIIEALGDEKSRPFYNLIVQRAPEFLIYRALSETKEESRQGTIKKSKGALFTEKIKRFAQEQGIELNLSKKPKKPGPVK